MISKSYISNAISTENNDFVKIKSRFSDSNIRILHGSIGLCTESLELNDAVIDSLFLDKNLDIINLKEEIGDLFWYLAIILDELKFDESKRKKSNIDFSIKKNKDNKVLYSTNLLCSKSSIFLDNIKKILFYGKDFDQQKTLNILNEILDCIDNICQLMNFNKKEIMQINQDKLNSRYGSKFSEEKAISRNIDQERKILSSSSD